MLIFGFFFLTFSFTIKNPTSKRKNRQKHKSVIPIYSIFNKDNKFEFKKKA